MAAVSDLLYTIWDRIIPHQGPRSAPEQVQQYSCNLLIYHMVILSQQAVVSDFGVLVETLFR